MAPLSHTERRPSLTLRGKAVILQSARVPIPDSLAGKHVYSVFDDSAVDRWRSEISAAAEGEGARSWLSPTNDGPGGWRRCQRRRRGNRRSPQETALSRRYLMRCSFLNGEELAYVLQRSKVVEEAGGRVHDPGLSAHFGLFLTGEKRPRRPSLLDDHLSPSVLLQPIASIFSTSFGLPCQGCPCPPPPRPMLSSGPTLRLLNRSSTATPDSLLPTTPSSRAPKALSGVRRTFSRDGSTGQRLPLKLVSSLVFCLSCDQRQSAVMVSHPVLSQGSFALVDLTIGMTRKFRLGSAQCFQIRYERGRPTFGLRPSTAFPGRGPRPRDCSLRA